ncbi:hypothetical protein QTP88_010982 [Uroleucon formosanum]
MDNEVLRDAGIAVIQPVRSGLQYWQGVPAAAVITRRVRRAYPKPVGGGNQSLACPAARCCRRRVVGSFNAGLWDCGGSLTGDAGFCFEPDSSNATRGLRAIFAVKGGDGF